MKAKAALCLETIRKLHINLLSIYLHRFPKVYFLFNKFLSTVFIDYASFFKLILRLMQTGFGELKTIDVDMKFAAQDEAIPQPDAKEYGMV